MRTTSFTAGSLMFTVPSLLLWTLNVASFEGKAHGDEVRSQEGSQISNKETRMKSDGSEAVLVCTSNTKGILDWWEKHSTRVVRWKTIELKQGTDQLKLYVILPSQTSGLATVDLVLYRWSDADERWRLWLMMGPFWYDDVECQAVEDSLLISSEKGEFEFRIPGKVVFDAFSVGADQKNREKQKRDQNDLQDGKRDDVPPMK